MDDIGDSLMEYGIELITVENKHLDLPSDNKNAVYRKNDIRKGPMAATILQRVNLRLRL